jgi:hypothetical protein
MCLHSFCNAEIHNAIKKGLPCESSSPKVLNFILNVLSFHNDITFVSFVIEIYALWHPINPQCQVYLNVIKWFFFKSGEG